MGREKLAIKRAGNTIRLFLMRELGSIPTVHLKFETPFQSVKWKGVGKSASSSKQSYALTPKAELYTPSQLVE